jgi:hypothetical protein
MKIVRVTLILSLIPLGIALGRSFDPERRPTYTDPTYGFRIDAPRYPGSEVYPVMLFAPPENGFSASLIVNIQKVQTSRDEYAKASREQMPQPEWKINSEKMITHGGRDAILVDFERSLKGGPVVRHLQLSVIDKAQVYVVTCQALKSDFSKYEGEFRAALESFTITS